MTALLLRSYTLARLAAWGRGNRGGPAPRCHDHRAPGTPGSARGRMMRLLRSTSCGGAIGPSLLDDRRLAPHPPVE